jgi:hypothetical protein
MKPIILLFLTTVILCSCDSEEETVHVIDPMLQSHVETFFIQAQSLDYNIQNTHDFTVKFGDLANAEENGKTFYNSRTIIIDSASVGYKNNPEALVLHELGHLILHRDHENEFVMMEKEVPNTPVKLKLFVPKSIMNCCSIPYYNSTGDSLRTYYIQELLSHTKR